jgi:copper homeostasis protein
MKRQLEIACFDLTSALIAHEAGADRIELCADLQEGGTTPAWELVMEARERIDIPLYLMIRPRGGDFNYSEDEFEQMKNDIVTFKRLGVHGFVFGVLTESQEIDLERNKDLIHFAYPLPCTFHRAFDRTKDIYKTLEILIDCGFQTVLTSGGAANVIEGMSALKKLVAQAGDRICIMPGGGLRSLNIAQLQMETQAHFYHSSAIVDNTMIANAAEVKAIKRLLD